jgi:hypothetical protein
MDNVTQSPSFINWITGFRLYNDGFPLDACANNKQRQGWRDAAAGERACQVVDAVKAAGGNAERADYVLANGFGD